MMERKAKTGISALLIAGIIFTCMGAIYLAVGICFHFFAVNEISLIFLYAFGGLGMLFFILGVIFLTLEIRKRLRFNRLLQSGNYITAEISEINLNYSVRINGRHPYVVVCRYQDMMGTIHLFKSRNLSFDPGTLFQGQTVKIYVDGEDFKHYYMDIDEVLPKIIQH